MKSLTRLYQHAYKRVDSATLPAQLPAYQDKC